MIRSTDDLLAVTGIPFSDEQLQAITAPLEPGVIIAGAGTGKTTVMAARVVWLVGTGQVRADQVLGLTFTRKAAAELGERIRRSLEDAGLGSGELDAGHEAVSTYDAFAAHLVGEYGLRGGLDAAPVLVSGAARFQIMTGVVMHAPGPYETLADLAPSTVVERALALDAELQSHLVDIGTVRDWTKRAQQQFAEAPGHGKGGTKRYASMVAAEERCAQRLELLDLVERYQQRKRELGVAEFADQLRTAATLARTVPSIGEALRGLYRVVLLDEYQDTSSAQAMLLSSLFRGHPVTAVGDPYQAIYGWRGAAASNILEFESDFGAAGKYTLRTNRRSHTSILEVGNAMASTIPGGEGVGLRAPDGTEEGSVVAVRMETEDDEVRWITEQILQLEGSVPWSRIAVTCRRNATLGKVHASLRAVGVPTEIVGLGGLLGLPEIVPVVWMLRVLADPLANPAVAGLLTSERWQLGLADLAVLGAHAKTLAGDDEASSLLEAAAEPPAGISDEGRAILRSFTDDVARLRRHLDEPAPDLVHRVVRVLGIEEELLARGEDPTQLEVFIEACAARPVFDGDASVVGLLAWLDAEERDGRGLEPALPSSGDAVQLLTVHRAKGLEWEHVFLPGLCDGMFPSRYRGGNWVHSGHQLPAPLRGDAKAIPQLEEVSDASFKVMKEELKLDHGHGEDRLAYVAATRARSRLVVSCHDWSPGVKGRRVASRYFEAAWAVAERQGNALDLSSGAEENPLLDDAPAVAWPPAPPSEVAQSHRGVAELVASAEDAGWVAAGGTLTPEDEERFRIWDDTVAHLEALRQRRELTLPRGLSATQLMQLHADPQAFAETLARRMPRRPSGAATLGTAFHDWVQRRFELPSGFDEFEPVHAPGLDALIEAFEAGRFATKVPIAVEVPFVMAVGEHQLRGRMDAVYAWEGEYDELVVDWKTFDSPADELQLAVYRRAWAEARGLDVARIGAAFHHVRSDTLVMASADPSLVEEALGIAPAPRKD